MSQEECEVTLGTTIKRRSERYLMLPELRLGGHFYKSFLKFDLSSRGLERVEVIVAESQSFWNTRLDAGEFSAINEVYDHQYKLLVEHYRKRIGPEDYAATWEDEYFPAGAFASHVTYWQFPKWRFQVEVGQADKEFPIIVQVVWYEANDD